MQGARYLDSSEGRKPRSIKKQVFYCQVDGCSAKLSNCKAYCVRYRVCQQHLGAAAVLIDGVQSRFCQQCGRFEELSEFDGAKRSCRTRLAHHNNIRQQRRKEAATAQLMASSVLELPRSSRPSAARQPGTFGSMFDSPQSSPEHTPEYEQYSGPHRGTGSRYNSSTLQQNAPTGRQAETGSMAPKRREQPGVGSWQGQQAAITDSSMEHSTQQGFGSSRWTQAKAVEFFVNKANQCYVWQQQEQQGDTKQAPYQQPTQQPYTGPTQQRPQPPQLESTLPWQQGTCLQDQHTTGRSAGDTALAPNMQSVLGPLPNLQDPKPLPPAWQPASLQGSQHSRPWHPHEAAEQLHAASFEGGTGCAQGPDASVTKGSVSTPQSGSVSAFAATCQFPPSDSNSSSPSTGSEMLQVKAHLWTQQQTQQQQVHTPSGMPAPAGAWGSTSHAQETGAGQQFAAMQLAAPPFAGPGCFCNSSASQRDLSNQPVHGRSASSAALKGQAPAYIGASKLGPVLQTPQGHPPFQARSVDPSTLRQDSSSSSSSCWLGHAGNTVTRHHPQVPRQQQLVPPWAASAQHTAAFCSAQLASGAKPFSPGVLSAPPESRVLPAVPVIGTGTGLERSSAPMSVQRTAVLGAPGGLRIAVPGAGNTLARGPRYVQELQHPCAGGGYGSSVDTRADCMSSMTHLTGELDLLQGIGGPMQDPQALPVLSTDYGQHQPPAQQQQEEPPRYTCSLNPCSIPSQVPTAPPDSGAAVSPCSALNQLPADAAAVPLSPAQELPTSQHSLQVATPSAASSLPCAFGPSVTPAGQGPAPVAGSFAACNQGPCKKAEPAAPGSHLGAPHEQVALVADCYLPPAAISPMPVHSVTANAQGQSTAAAGHTVAAEEAEDALAGLDSLLADDTRDHVADLFQWAADGADLFDFFDNGCP